MNESLFVWLNGIGAVIPDALWIHVTNLGDASIALSLLILLYSFKREPGAAILVLAIVATMIIQGMKAYFGVLRPPSVLPEGTFNLIGEAIRTHSFPSGHTATIFVCAGILMAQYRTIRVSCAALVVASVVGISRIMVGAHWPSDVLVGAVLGWVVGYWGYRLFASLPIKPTWSLSLGGLAVVIVIANQLFYSLPYQEFAGVSYSRYLYICAALIGGWRFAQMARVKLLQARI